MLIVIKMLKGHVKALVLPGESTVAVVSPVMEIFPYFYSVRLHFFPFLCEGDWNCSLILWTGIISYCSSRFCISLSFSLCVCVCITKTSLFKGKGKRERCDTRTVHPTCHKPACWRNFSFKAVSLGSQLTYDSTTWNCWMSRVPSTPHLFKLLLFSFCLDIHKYERKETYSSVWYAEHFIV